MEARRREAQIEHIAGRTGETRSKELAMSSIPVTLNHIALDVADVERSAAFYADLLGTQVVANDLEHRITFLRLPGSSNYSDMALHEHPDMAAAYPTQVMRMAHTGWSVTERSHLVEAHRFFTERTRVYLAADFGVALSVMGADPDGHVVEFELFTVGAEDVEPGFRPLSFDELCDLAAV
jgi:catechol-2,3-dioxygenase